MDGKNHARNPLQPHYTICDKPMQQVIADGNKATCKSCLKGKPH